MKFNPSQFRLVLAGPKIARFYSTIAARGYDVESTVDGASTLALLRELKVHLLLVELELGDMLLGDLLPIVRRDKLVESILLFEEPAKSGMIISMLVHGIDGYAAAPPDEDQLFRVIDRQLLAQLATIELVRGAADEASALDGASEPTTLKQPVVPMSALREQRTLPPASPVPVASSMSSALPTTSVPVATSADAPATVVVKTPMAGGRANVIEDDDDPALLSEFDMASFAGPDDVALSPSSATDDDLDLAVPPLPSVEAFAPARAEAPSPPTVQLDDATTGERMTPATAQAMPTRPKVAMDALFNNLVFKSAPDAPPAPLDAQTSPKVSPPALSKTKPAPDDDDDELFVDLDDPTLVESRKSEIERAALRHNKKAR